MLCSMNQLTFLFFVIRGRFRSIKLRQEGLDKNFYDIFGKEVDEIKNKGLYG